VPPAAALIQTSLQAGGIFSSPIRFRSAALTLVPQALLYLNPRAGVPTRRIPDL
jgi:hypothetical protein